MLLGDITYCTTVLKLYKIQIYELFYSRYNFFFKFLKEVAPQT